MKQRLHELLQELHTELGNADAMDDQAREELRGLAGEIESAVGAETQVIQGDVSQLQQSVLEFETEHPRISGILGQIADTLSKLGI